MPRKIGDKSYKTEEERKEAILASKRKYRKKDYERTEMIKGYVYSHPELMKQILESYNQVAQKSQ